MEVAFLKTCSPKLCPTTFISTVPNFAAPYNFKMWQQGKMQRNIFGSGRKSDYVTSARWFRLPQLLSSAISSGLFTLLMHVSPYCIVCTDHIKSPSYKSQHTISAFCSPDQGTARNRGFDTCCQCRQKDGK